MEKSESLASVVKDKQLYFMKLYVVAGEQNSQIARDNLKRICDEYLRDQCRVEEVDVLADFASALEARVFVTPTLILVEPEPKAVVVGNLGNKERVISALRLRL